MNGNADSDSDSDDDDEDDDSSDDDEDEKPAAKSAAVKKTEDDDESSEGTSDDDDDEDSDEEEVKPAAKSKSKAAPKAAAKEENDEDEDSDDSESDDDDEDEVEDKVAMEVDEKPNGESGLKSPYLPHYGRVHADLGPGKRKAEENPAPAKKAKTELGAPGGEEEPTLTVFVGQLSWNVDDDWLGSEFESCGAIESAKVMLDRDNGRSKGIGFVTFTDLESSAKAVELNGKEIDGRTIKVNYAKPRQPREAAAKRANAFGDQSSPPNVTLYVGGLSYSMGEDDVYEAFGEFGDIQRVRIPTDRDTGAPKGYAYVEFADLDQSKAAYEAMQGKELGGRYIRVDYDRPKDSNGFSGGRGGGRGGFTDRGRGRGGFGGDRGGRGGFGGRGGGRGGFGDRGGRGGRGFGGGRGRGAPRG